jgi:tetratricopeptide (TPR) repeat protein
MRGTRTLFALLISFSGAGFAQLLPPNSICDQVKGPQAVTVGGRTLREAPDLATDELRNINAMMNVRGCFNAAQQHLAEYVKQHPDDYTVAFVEARLAWFSMGADQAEAVVRNAATHHPDFASAHVLLASIALERGDTAAASAEVELAAKSSPDDLWLYITQLKLRASAGATDDTRKELIALALAPAAPGFAREAAAMTALNQARLSAEQTESIYRALLTFKSATPESMKKVNLARFLIEERRTFDSARALIAAQASAGDENAQVLIAESYLLEAAKLDTGPSEKNASLVAKAKDALGGDLSRLAPRVTSWENLAPLRPFVFGSEPLASPDARDYNGATALCNAAVNLDPDAVARSLAAGADVDGECNGTTPLGWVVANLSQDYDAKRSVCTLLLDHGADPNAKIIGGEYTAIGFCADGFPICAKELLPLLQRYVKPAKQ